MTDEQTQASEELEQENAEELDEQLDDEQAKAIEELSAAIEQMDKQLKAHRTGNIDAIKQAELKALGYTAEQVERYQTHIEGDTDEEIKASVLELSMDLPPPADNWGDPSLMNGAKVKPETVGEDQLKEIGRKAFQRVRHKIRGLGGR